MGKNPGQAAPAVSAASTDSSTGTANTEPSDAELKSIIFNGSKSRVSKAKVEDTDDNEPLDQDDAAESADADLSEDGDEDQSGDDDNGSATKRRTQPAASESDATADADATADDTKDSDDDQGEADSQTAADETATDPDEALDDEIAEARAEFTPAQQKVFDRALRKKTQRVIKLRTEIEALSQRATQAEAALDEARNSAPAASVAPTAQDPLADVHDEAALDQRMAQARKLRRWCIQNRDGGVIKEGDREIEVPAERAAELLEQAEETLETHAPKRRAFLGAKVQMDRQAEVFYPWLKNRTAQATRAVESTLKQFPQLAALLPGAKLAVADMLMGAHLRQAQSAKAKDGAGAAGGSAATDRKAPPKAPATPAGGARPPRVNGAFKANGDAQRKLDQTGDDPDNAALRGLIARR